MRLSRDEEGRPSMVTTNFDTLFERALSRSRDRTVATEASTAGQNIPAPGTERFHGIIHLHGRLADASLKLLILTSGQYDEAYLRAGWAARFFFDLARCRTFVLVGYSADDAPVRYILNVLEADRTRFTDLEQSMGSIRSDDEGTAAARWEALAVDGGGARLRAVAVENNRFSPPVTRALREAIP
ncbi:SIR2 family protein [Bosea sp. NPDC055353]